MKRVDRLYRIVTYLLASGTYGHCSSVAWVDPFWYSHCICR